MDSRIKIALQFVDDNYCHQPTVSDVSSKCGLARHTLNAFSGAKWAGRLELGFVRYGCITREHSSPTLLFKLNR